MQMRKLAAGAVVFAIHVSSGNADPAARSATTAATCNAPIQANSGPQTVSIVELYTSEGCDSCPPADQWFSRLESRGSAIIPMAFHVDYWDYIGWKDPFASALYTQRQREAVTRQGSRTTYTPQVMVDGRDMRAWSNDSQFQSRVHEVSARTPRAEISVDAKFAGNTVEAGMQANVALAADRPDAVVYFALTEDKLVSRVTAGENRSKTLKHDHVVRELVGPIALDARDRAAGKFQLSRTLSLAPDWKREDLSLVTFVQSARTGEVLQALVAPLCGS